MVVARCYDRIKRKRRDLLHKLARYYVSNYDVVAVEDLNVHGMMQQDRNSRNTAHSAWRTFIELLRYKAENAGTHLVEINLRGTTTECYNCGLETDKSLWVRKHSCPACGYEDDRDANAAKVLLQRTICIRYGTGRIHTPGDSDRYGYACGICTSRRRTGKTHT